MTTSQQEVTTPDGAMRIEIVTPARTGPWPAVILFFDAGGLRPAMTTIAERIASAGYLVALPDLFHRAGPIARIIPAGAAPGNVMAIFGDADARAKFMTEYYGPALDYDHLRGDVGAVLAYLATRGDVTGKIGTTGYCMGGNASLRTATLFGDRIAATASFHGGGLVTPEPTSPHLRAADIKSRVYVAGAIEDASFSDDAKAQLEAALTAARVAHTIETYPARHGFAVPDHAGVYDAAAAERHHVALDTLFAATLR